jgi:type VI protein secretion system component Hcp
MQSLPFPAGHDALWGRATQEKNMNHKILIAAFAGLSLVAASQSTTDKQKAKASTTQPASKDAAKDQRLGNKTAQDDWQQTAAKPASGNKMAHDDWQQTTAKPASGSNTKPTHVAIGEVNGDGRMDVAVSNNSATGSSKDPASRDDASGQATGRRQHQPVTITKEVDKASTRVATGDVNGDGAPDLAASKNSAHATESATSTASGSSNVQGSRDAASGQMAGKRQHQPMTVKKEVDKATPLLRQ